MFNAIETKNTFLIWKKNGDWETYRKARNAFPNIDKKLFFVAQIDDGNFGTIGALLLMYYGVDKMMDMLKDELGGDNR
jgi:hypothetical protein